MWIVEIWLKPLRRWSKVGETTLFQEALEAVKATHQKHHTVTRATLRDPKPDEYCGITAYPYRGVSWWTSSGGLASSKAK